MTSLFDLVYLQNLCKKYQVYPSKKYGQNFLINPAPIEKMLEAAMLHPDDTIIEIGPGFGVLTLALAQQVKKIYAFEIEKRLERYWNECIKKNQNIEIVWGNVLRQWNSIPVLKKYKVVANLPYQITSPAIRLFLEHEHPPECLVLMVQKEVAERICAKPGDLSVLAISVQVYGSAEYLGTVPRSSFWPEPRVDSAMLSIKPHDIEVGFNAELFFKVVRTGFSNKRKLLIKNLQFLNKDFNRARLAIIFDELGLSSQTRAQELSIEQWKQLVKKIAV